MSNSRSTIFIDRKVQGALARRIAVHWCTFFTLAALCLFAQEYFLGEPNSGIVDKAKTVANQYAFFFLLLLCMVPAFLYDTVKLSNRFVGPVLRLKNSLRSLADGHNVSPIKFRGGDFWHELASDFNRLNDKVGSHLQDSAEPQPTHGPGMAQADNQTIVPPVQVNADAATTFDNSTSS